MLKLINKFRKDEDGAVTVDWVVLTAAVVALAGAAYGSIQSGSTGLTASTATFMGNQAPN
jgi:Flp pilus assembly pilin Flp